MSNQSYLIFTLNGEHFAIDALSVKEIISLPELIFEEEVPAFIAGAFNLRGKIVHVIDLNLCLGHKPERYSLSDKVVVLDLEGRLFGIIVSDVLDVIPISNQDIEEVPEHRFIKGEAKVGEEIIMLIDHNKMREASNEIRDTLHDVQDTPHSFTSEEQAIFHDRARALMQPPESLTLEGLVPLAVVGLNGEYYGAELESIREFSDVRNVTPVPCTPAHIVGDMNLRGDILTIVDIKGMLNIPVKSASKGKVVVAGIDDLLVGIAVDEVFEVINLSPSDIRPVPSAVEAAGQEYIKGEAPYNQKMMSILDLKKILTREELVVKE